MIDKKKFILIPDSFKGTLSSARICELISDKINKIFNESEIVSLPVADGGEGTVDCFLAATDGEKVFTRASDPFGEQINAYYARFGDTAVIETAATAGLPLVENRKNPLKASTYGLGEQISHAVSFGAKKIIIGLGGSCTNDFGCGAACALGARFYDKDGRSFVPTGETLINIEKIELGGVKTKGVFITAMCDVDNPPFGENGAARVFAPQKGADEAAVKLLDAGVKHVCEVIKRDFGADYSELKGGGAAGALGAGARFFLGAELKSGISTVLDTLGFDEKIKGADYIFTGEGKIDGQSLRGKVVAGVAERAEKAGVPVIAIVGGADGDMTELYAAGVTAVFPINRLPQDFSVSRRYSEENLSRTAEDVLRLLKVLAR